MSGEHPALYKELPNSMVMFDCQVCGKTAIRHKGNAKVSIRRHGFPTCSLRCGSTLHGHALRGKKQKPTFVGRT